jgi:hypothetical protein
MEEKPCRHKGHAFLYTSRNFFFFCLKSDGGEALQA